MQVFGGILRDLEGSEIPPGTPPNQSACAACADCTSDLCAIVRTLRGVRDALEAL